jgi:hypothetical protein
MEHIHPLQLILFLALIGVFVFMQWKKKQAARPAKGPSGPAKPNRARTAEEIYMDLRRKALATTPQNLGRDPKSTEPYGLLMEMGIQISVVTLVCFADGDANVYHKTGGGMIGGSSHESVRKTAKAFIDLAPKALPKMIKTADFPLPGPDRVRFYALTPQGVFTTETNRQALADPRSDLGALFYAGQEVVAEMRQVQEQKQEERRQDQRPAAAPPPPDPAVSNS